MLFHRAWLGMRDSNPRMLGPEPSALPLGESPRSDRKENKINFLFWSDAGDRFCEAKFPQTHYTTLYYKNKLFPTHHFHATILLTVW